MKFRKAKTIIPLILKTYVHYIRHRFFNQKLNEKAVVHIFTKMKIADSWK